MNLAKIVKTDDNHKDTLVCELQKSNSLKDISTSKIKITSKKCAKSDIRS